MNIIKKYINRQEILFLISVISIFIVLRLPSLIEPLWYGDEAIYQVIGNAINSDRVLYKEIWDNKPPLLYYIYALVNGDQFTVRFISLIIGAVTIIPFFILSKKLFTPKKAYITTGVFSLLFALPLLEGNIANAENFILLPVIISALIVYITVQAKQQSSKPILLKYFVAGLFLGIGFLFKIVVVFDLFAFLLFIAAFKYHRRLNNLHIFQKIHDAVTGFTFIIAGFLIPIAVISIYYSINGNFNAFIQSAFLENISYVEYANTLIFPQGLLILKLFILFLICSLIFNFSRTLKSNAVFIFFWLTLSLWNSLFSGRIWIHYLLTVLPAFALLIGLFPDKNKMTKLIALLFAILILIISNLYFKINLANINKSVFYYNNFMHYISGNIVLNDYQSFFDTDVPRDYAVGKYLKTKTAISDNIFIWGNNPQVYTLAGKLPPGKYTVAYHILQNPGAISETINTLRQTKPKFIVILEDNPDFPFSLNTYHYVYNIKGAKIYEKSY